MSGFPSVQELAKYLYDVVKTIDSDCDDGIDVRLQVAYGDWVVHTGDPCYDQDHNGWWGAGSLSATDTMRDCRETARDLIEQAIEHKAQCEEVS